MSWDKAKPAGSQKIRLADDDIRANNDALETAIGQGHDFSTTGTQTGKHTAPTFIDNGADPTQPTATNEIALYNKGGLLYAFNQAGNKFGIGIPPGTKMLFKQAAAPAGWTFLSEDNDRLLLNTSTESQGGTNSGSWTISGFSFSVDEHVLTTDEIPSHTHDITTDDNEHNVGFVGEGAGGAKNTRATAATGGGTGHAHGFTSSHDGSWRPATTLCITCQKD